ncbi:toll/interleukin-1 receptor domain-containing protein [Thalassomonas actiniarum]|uniref:Toll/interleukin-1 receptor domain-containing protein n=1 Tax=Thalassomonas actiniarum TaxID=485447 RepID=A0AAE9YNG5_9GAMM|nr:toll/interleukin-1 receptor domain-containing protein [Thalassomonas actiniarum]WDD97891.1 toll/interleukin-1 receptor domain-containing protein [Thalassomonas actiniarum]
MSEIFISHSHADHRLAERLHNFLTDISDNKFEVHRSSDISAIPTGTPWKKWIDDNIVNCDVAIVLLTESSLRGRWVLWEAGAVAGVQYYRDKAKAPKQEAGEQQAVEGRVRVLNFGISSSDMGPFAGDQAQDGRNPESVSQFAFELLETFQQKLGKTYAKSLMQLDEKARNFVEQASEDLRFTPIPASEPLVQNWLSQLDRALEEQNYHWATSAKRWINIAFLGIGKAGESEPIDFRIHLRLARAFEAIGDKAEAIRQLQLARGLSPNDMLVHRALGKLYREYDEAELQKTLAKMEDMDPKVFSEDREAIALMVGDLFDKGAYERVVSVLNDANKAVVEKDAYLLNWRALATLKHEGPEAARARFSALERFIGPSPGNFWELASQINALMVKGEEAPVIEALEKLVNYKESKGNLNSASKYFDEICDAVGLKVPWREILGMADDA